MKLVKKDIADLKGCKNPHESCKLITDILMMTLEKKHGWEESKKTMGQRDFIEQLANYDYRNVKAKTYEKVVDKLAQNPQLTWDYLKKISMVCSYIGAWIEQWVEISKAYFEKASLEAQLKCLKKTGKRFPDVELTPELIGMIVAKQVKA